MVQDSIKTTQPDDCFVGFQALFVKVMPYQCLGCVWSQRDKKENMSPTIRATINQFNAVTNRVITSLLCWPTSSNSSPTSSRSRPPSTPAQRARIIEKWIRVAQVSQNARNAKLLIYIPVFSAVSVCQCFGTAAQF